MRKCSAVLGYIVCISSNDAASFICHRRLSVLTQAIRPRTALAGGLHIDQLHRVMPSASRLQQGTSFHKDACQQHQLLTWSLGPAAFICAKASKVMSVQKVHCL